MLIHLIVSIGLTCSAGLAICLSDDANTTEQTQRTAEVQKAAEAPADAPVSKETDSPAPPAWTLRYKFLPDQKLRYKSTESVTLDAMVGENRKVDVTGIEQRRVFTVTSVDDANAAKFTMQYEFVKMQVQTNEFEPVVFDTTMKPEEIPPSFRNTARALQGSAPRFWISSLGSPLRESDLTNGGAPTSTAVARAGNVTVTPRKSESSASDIQQVSATTAEPNSQTPDSARTDKPEAVTAVTFLMPLPEQAVEIGETWREVIPVSVRVTEDINRTVNILRTFRLESVENGIATISFRSSVEAAIKSPTLRSQLIKATPKGTLTFDVERGVMLKRVINYDEMVMNAIGQNSVVLCNGSSTEVLLEDGAE
ncbi:MAG TPA: hypothetical protein PLY87_06490 [Planctomycetaceae bacterium]|nr:hypothetical protein [Planctomycetaceae bacterium]HQZ64702.1 hypothetical protein [Planctomycetaceae bacterium]